jgi:hypothetical protein
MEVDTSASIKYQNLKQKEICSNILKKKPATENLIYKNGN